MNHITNNDAPKGVGPTTGTEVNSYLQKAMKTAGPRSMLGLYIAYNNPETILVTMVATSCFQHEWVKNIEHYSNEKINTLLEYLPNGLKSNFKVIYTSHAGYVQSGNSIMFITPLINSLESVIATKIGVQAINRGLNIVEETKKESDKSITTAQQGIQKVGERVRVGATTITVARMFTKPHSFSAAIAGVQAVSYKPGLSKKVHDLVQEKLNKLPRAVEVITPIAYGVHEVAMEYFGYIPYVTPAVMAAEFATSFYLGAKYMLHNIQEADKSQ